MASSLHCDNKDCCFYDAIHDCCDVDKLAIIRRGPDYGQRRMCAARSGGAEMIAKAEISYFETGDHWYWSVTAAKGQAQVVISDGVEPIYEDAIERVRDELEELVDGIDVES